MRILEKLVMVVVAATFGAAAGFATAGVIYDGGQPDRTGGIYFADRKYPFTADAVPFTLQPGATIVTDAHWWGGCFDAFGGTGFTDCTNANFIVEFLSDNAGAPGAVIVSFNEGTANQTATGFDIAPGTSSPEYSYSATFPGVSLSAGVQYWLSISNDTTGGTAGTWGMETTAPGGNVPQEHGQFLNDGTGWLIFEVPLAFNLTNDQAAVPEPATLALLGLGLAGLGFSRRRKST